MSAENNDWEGEGRRIEDRGDEEQRDRSPERRHRSRSRSPARMDVDRNYRDREDRGRGDVSVNTGNNLHVSGLSSRVEDRDLEETFGKFGKIERCQLMVDPHTKESRGFAFVTMNSAEEADAAIAGLTGTELMGKLISVQKARRGRARTPTPGQYHGPPKLEDRRGGGSYRPYDPRYPPRDYYDDYDRRRDYRGGGGYRDRGGYAVPMRDDRRYDYDRYDRYERERERDRYDRYEDRRRY